MGNCQKCKLAEKFGQGMFYCEFKRHIHYCVNDCSGFKSKNKYNNAKVKSDGITFDSKKEHAKYNELVMMQKAGIISDLRSQVKFEIIPKDGDERAAFYVADFVYKTSDGKTIVEDVKSAITKKNPVYILKRKLFKHIYKEYLFRES